MTDSINVEELNALADVTTPEELLGADEPEARGPSTEQDEPDDGVEALIVRMDRTTAEHLFLQAQRLMQREAANARVDTDH
ncbi:MAG TPA: hypothetical protein VH590_01050 [Ktedonobacterales bacterium]|jgi:hypothetical protein